MVLEKLGSAQFKAMNLVQISNSFLLRAPEITENTFNLHFYTHKNPHQTADGMIMCRFKKQNKNNNNQQKELP